MNILTGNKRDAETSSEYTHSFRPEFISALFQGLTFPLHVTLNLFQGLKCPPGRDSETSSE